jgi:hypothetical protein
MKRQITCTDIKIDQKQSHPSPRWQLEINFQAKQLRVILPRRSGQRFSHSRTDVGSPISPNTNNDQK